MRREWQLSEPGTQRPGGRTERTRVAVLMATLDELAERGYAGLTVEAVAARSGVHKTTVYRRWASAEGWSRRRSRWGPSEWTPPDTGSLQGDLAGIGRELVRYFTEPSLSALPMASISAAFLSERAAESLRAYYEDRHARCAVVVERAVARGEVPADIDAVEVVRAATAPVFYRLFVSREAVDDSVADNAARVAVVAAKAGAFAGGMPRR